MIRWAAEAISSRIHNSSALGVLNAEVPAAKRRSLGLEVRSALEGLRKKNVLLIVVRSCENHQPKEAVLMAVTRILRNGGAAQGKNRDDRSSGYGES